MGTTTLDRLELQLKKLWFRSSTSPHDLEILSAYYRAVIINTRYHNLIEAIECGRTRDASRIATTLASMPPPNDQHTVRQMAEFLGLDLALKYHPAPQFIIGKPLNIAPARKRRWWRFF